MKLCTVKVWKKAKSSYLHNLQASKLCILITTRTKTSIRYAKENDREKRERRKERERKVKGEI